MKRESQIIAKDTTIRDFRNLGARVMAFIRVPVLPFHVIIGGVPLGLVGDSVFHLTKDELQVGSEGVAYQVDEFLMQYIQISSQLARNADLQQMMTNSNKSYTTSDDVRFANLYQTMQNARGTDGNILSIFVTDVNTEQSISANGGNNKSYTTTEHPQLIKMKKENGITFTEPYGDINTRQQVVMIASSVYKKGTSEIIDAVGLDPTLTSLSGNARFFKIGQEGYYVLVSSDGSIISHPKNEYLN